MYSWSLLTLRTCFRSAFTAGWRPQLGKDLLSRNPDVSVDGLDSRVITMNNVGGLDSRVITMNNEESMYAYEHARSENC
jgi:hypothetical protein